MTRFLHLSLIISLVFQLYIISNIYFFFCIFRFLRAWYFFLVCTAQKDLFQVSKINLDKLLPRKNFISLANKCIICFLALPLFFFTFLVDKVCCITRIFWYSYKRQKNYFLVNSYHMFLSFMFKIRSDFLSNNNK